MDQVFFGAERAVFGAGVRNRYGNGSFVTRKKRSIKRAKVKVMKKASKVKSLEIEKHGE